MKNIYLDTETTSTVPGQIAELSMIVEDEGTSEIEAVHNFFFKVDKMDPGAQKVHGFSVEDLNELSNGKTFKDLHEEILSILQGNRLIAHNEAFDEKFICSELWRCGISFKPENRLCTMQAFTPVVKIPSRYPKHGQYKYPKLVEVTHYFGVDPDKIKEYTHKLFGTNNENFHDSRYDTVAMYIVVNIQRELITGGNLWQSTFCNQYNK